MVIYLPKHAVDGFIMGVTFDLYAVGSNSSAVESRLLAERSPLSSDHFFILSIDI